MHGTACVPDYGSSITYQEPQMLTLMHGTACGPDYVLQAGQVYDLPRAIAHKLCNTNLIGAATAKKVKGKKGDEEVEEIVVSSAGPAASIISKDQLKKGQKVLKMNPRPDPEEQTAVLVDDDGQVAMIGDPE
jgi:pyrroline-5-carboxylate reductase